MIIPLIVGAAMGAAQLSAGKSANKEQQELNRESLDLSKEEFNWKKGVWEKRQRTMEPIEGLIAKDLMSTEGPEHIAQHGLIKSTLESGYERAMRGLDQELEASGMAGGPAGAAIKTGGLLNLAKSKASADLNLDIQDMLSKRQARMGFVSGYNPFQGMPSQGETIGLLSQQAGQAGQAAGMAGQGLSGLLSGLTKYYSSRADETAGITSAPSVSSIPAASSVVAPVTGQLGGLVQNSVESALWG